MTSRFSDHLLSGVVATIPDPDAVPEGTLYMATDEDIIYQSNGVDTWAEWMPAGAGGGGGSNLNSGRVVRTAGDLTTTSTSMVDVTGASITFTTGARKVLLNFSATAKVTDPFYVRFDFVIDGTRVAATHAYGLATMRAVNGVPVSFTYLTDTLSAASHTFKVQWSVDGGTGTIFGGTSDNPWAVFTAVEQYA